MRQAQRRAAGNRSEHKYSKKYVFISKNMTFGPLGHVLTLLNGPPDSYWKPPILLPKKTQKKNRKNIICENFCFLMSLGGGFRKGQKGP